LRDDNPLVRGSGTAVEKNRKKGVGGKMQVKKTYPEKKVKRLLPSRQRKPKGGQTSTRREEGWNGASPGRKGHVEWFKNQKTNSKARELVGGRRPRKKKRGEKTSCPGKRVCVQESERGPIEKKKKGGVNTGKKNEKEKQLPP